MSLVHRSVLGAACLVALVACSRSERAGERTTGERTTTGDRPAQQPGTEQPSGMRQPTGAGQEPGTTTVTGADVRGLSSDLAVQRIVAARCQRESSCNNVGADKHYATIDNCTRELRTKVGDDLKPSECPRGIDAKELDECMESIRTESCNNPIDTISRLAACRTSDMCLKTDAPNR